MDAHIWNIKSECWFYVRNVRFIVMLDSDTFKIDGIEYNTSEYELNFIHSEGE